MSTVIMHSAVSVDGFFAALAGWRAVANHLPRLPCEQRCVVQDLRLFLIGHRR